MGHTDPFGVGAASSRSTRVHGKLTIYTAVNRKNISLRNAFAIMMMLKESFGRGTIIMIEKRGLIIHPHELDESWLERFKSLQLNVLGLHPVGGTNASESLQNMLDHWTQMKPLIDQAEEMGITVEFEMHALGYLMPKAQFTNHPDWFCMNENGERTADSYNICASNPEGLEALSESAARLARILPSKDHLYYFWLDDVVNCSCHCERCKVLTPSDQQMILVNAMQKGIRRVDPQGCMAYLAYLDTLAAPVHVKPDEGVFLEFAPIHRSVNHAINDASCEENVKESASLPSLLKTFGTKNAKVLDYWTDNSLFSGWKYPPKAFRLNAEIMKRDVAYYHALGFESLTAFGCYLGKDYIDLHGVPDLDGYREAMMEE